jgi:hypothetical protein
MIAEGQRAFKAGKGNPIEQGNQQPPHSCSERFGKKLQFMGNKMV